MPLTIFRRILFRGRYAVPLMLLLGVGVSSGLYYAINHSEEKRIREDIRQRAEARHALVRQSVSGHLESLRPLQKIFEGAGLKEPPSFRRIAQDALAQHPGFDAIQWVAFETDPKTGAVTLPIRLNEGRSRDAYLAIGYDYASGPLKAHFERARQTRRPTVSPPVLLFERPNERCVLTIFPVVAPTAPAGAANPSADGFVVGVIYPPHLFNQTRVDFPDTVTEVMFLDATSDTPSEHRLLHYWSTGAGTPASTPSETTFRDGNPRETPVPIGDRTWSLLHRTHDGWWEQQHTYVPALVFSGGILLTILFTAYGRGAVRRAELVEQEVQTRTAELRRTQALLEEDIERRQEVETLLRASQQQLNGLMENSPNAIFVKDPEGRYLSVNKRYAELHGREREDFLGHGDFDIFPPETAARIRMSDARVVSTGQPVELEDTFSSASGTHTSIVHKFAIIDEEGRVHGLCGIATEISERKRAEAEIRENRRQLESILGQLPGMAFRMVQEGTSLSPVYISRGALGLTGHSARDFLEKLVQLHSIIHPDDRERAHNAINNAVRKRRSYEIEYRIVDRTGRVKWVLDRGQGVYNEDGRLLFIEGLAIDITQRKDAESEKLIVERRLLEGQKLESIGVLAGGIAHDFNNLLTGIIGNANLAGLELPRTSPIQQNLKQIETASQRAAELCQQMLAYAGKGRFLIQRVELGPLVDSTVPLLRASISKRATLRFMLQPDLPPIMADPTQMRQIVMNLVINASEALGENNGAISITTTLMRPLTGFFENAALTPPEPAGDFVQLEVADTGSGMTAETLAKIFDPFFTTKFAGRGLGLAAVQGIIRSHRGGMKVHSTPGRGSTFTLFLPAAAPVTAEPAIPRRSTATPWRQKGRALIIDDEEQVLKVTSGMLQSFDMQTELARDGYEGIDLFRVHPGDFDLVLLDMTMPRLSGEETLGLLREIRPDVRVLFMSGYNRREVVATLGGAGELGFIQKPFTLEILREQIQTMLS